MVPAGERESCEKKIQISRINPENRKANYEEEYKRIEKNARRQTYKKSFISMFRNYLAISLVDENFIKENFPKKSELNILNGDSLSKILSEKLSKKDSVEEQVTLEPGKIPEDTMKKSLEEINNLISEAYSLKTPNSVRLASRAIRDNFFNDSIKSEDNWSYLVNSLNKLSKINSFSVREGLKYSFKKSNFSLQDYKLKLTLELGPEGKKIIEDLEMFAKELKFRGKNKLGIVNATFNGGGPAEMFATIGPLMAELGMEIEWHIIYPTTPKFYDISKGIHNTLQGNDVLWNPNLPEEDSERELNLKLDLLDKTNKINSEILSSFFEDEESAAIFIEDPQVIPLVEYGKNIKAWRLHTDISGIIKNNPGAVRVWEKFQTYLRNLEEGKIIMFQPGLVPPIENQKARIVEQYPGIDPLSEKNRRMKEDEFLDHIREINENKNQLFGNSLNIETPTIVTGSRFDYWKGLPIVLRAFEKNADINPSINLLIFGSYADDDPEGKAHFNLLKEMISQSKYNDRINLITGYSGRKIAALYNLASRNKMPFIAYSLKEGYNLMTNENEIQGGTSIVARTGGLKRYETGYNSLAALDIDDITLKIKDASELYKIENNQIKISSEALELEKRLSNCLKDLMENYNSLQSEKNESKSLAPKISQI